MENILNYVSVKITNALAGVEHVLIFSFLLVLSLMLVEALIIGYNRSSFRRLISSGSTSRIDVLSAFLVLSNLSLILGTIFSFGVLYIIGHIIKRYINLDLINYESYPVVGFIGYIIFLDFTNYWIHRWMHRSPKLWLLHRFHHSATEMTMLTVLRDHPLERAVLHCINAIPAGLLGIPPVHYVAATVIFQSIGFLKHSNINSDWGWFGRYIIQSPRDHRLHHSNEVKYYNCNFGSLFQTWDVIFKSAKNTNKYHKINIGLDGGHRMESNPFFEMWNVTKAFYTSIIRHP